jgi:hypothetical protein
LAFSAFIFAARTHYGLSIQSSGSNLPRLNNDDEWRPLGIKITTIEELVDFTEDIATARFNLLSRAYHFWRVKVANPLNYHGKKAPHDQSSVWPSR